MNDPKPTAAVSLRDFLSTSTKFAASAAALGTLPVERRRRPDRAGTDITPLFDVVTGDLSFISLTLVLPALVPLLAEGGDLLMLVKPQFELQPGQIGKGGLVKDAASYVLVRERIALACVDNGLTLLDYFESAITGGDGNREFFVWAKRAA